MKLQVGYGSQTFRLSEEGFLRWYHKDAKKIKRGITYRHMLSNFWTAFVDTLEIYTIKEKDKINSTHWLIEHKVLNQEGKLEFKPLYQIYLNELVDKRNGYWTIRPSKYKTIISPKEYREFMKKIEEELEKKKKK